MAARMFFWKWRGGPVNTVLLSPQGRPHHTVNNVYTLCMTSEGPPCLNPADLKFHSSSPFPSSTAAAPPTYQPPPPCCSLCLQLFGSVGFLPSSKDHHPLLSITALSLFLSQHFNQVVLAVDTFLPGGMGTVIRLFGKRWLKDDYLEKIVFVCMWLKQ